MHFKRLSILLICLIFIFNPFLDGSFCYADSNGWENTTMQDQAEAFRAYCKSRNVIINGSALGAATSFTTRMYHDLCKSVGVDMDAMQSDIKKATDGNLGTKYLINLSGMNVYNALFREFLQNNDLEVGDEIPDDQPKIIYEGDYIDSNYLVYILNNNGTGLYNNNYIIQEGSDISTGGALFGSSGSFNLGDKTITYETKNANYANQYFSGTSWLSVYNNLAYIESTKLQPYGRIYDSKIAVAYKTTDQKYYLLLYTKYQDTNDVTRYDIKTPLAINFGSGDIDKGVTINITTNNQTINNNTYEGNTYTTINNNGDTNNYYGDQEPDSDDPIGGDPNDPNNPNNPNNPSGPSGGTPPDWDIGGGEGTATDGNGNTWNINFPDFELPDLNIDWSINGLGDKFPFSIPFDMVALITALSAEPEAPHFEGTVDFGFTDWDYDIDLQPFDTVAAACRIAELLLLVFGLILITRQIIKG